MSKVLKMPASAWRRLLAVRLAMSGDLTRPHLAALNIEVAKAAVTTAATNGHWLATHEEKHASGAEWNALLSPRTVAELRRCVGLTRPKKPKRSHRYSIKPPEPPIEREISLSIVKGRALVESTHTESETSASFPLVDEQFLPFRKVIPDVDKQTNHGPLICVGVYYVGLAAKLFAETAGKQGADGVVVAVGGPLDPIAMRSGGTIVVIMPMRGTGNVNHGDHTGKDGKLRWTP